MKPEFIGRINMEFVRIADKKRVEFITSQIKRNVAEGSAILDVGCGNGIISRAIGAAGFNVTGIDVSEQTIAQAKSHNKLSNVNFKVVAADELIPQPETFDAIICSEVIEHLSNPEKLLNILNVSLKKDGILIVTVPNGRGPRELFVTRPVQYIQKKNNVLTRVLRWVKTILGYSGTTIQSSALDLSHLQFFTLRTLSALAADTGFRITVIQRSNFIEQVFPFSLLTKRSIWLQKADIALANRLPLSFTSGFMTVWKKN
jgi:2-polyprenyl-3-methyl-5-hydroxy-6-metoxy-1,4-benzoquinol methylase